MRNNGWFDYRDKMAFEIPIYKRHFSEYVSPKVFRRKQMKWKATRYRRKKRPYVCPICKKAVSWLVKYHVSYDPEIIIYACRTCNKVEHKLRKGLPLTNRQVQVARRIIKGGFTYKTSRKIGETRDYSIYKVEYIEPTKWIIP